MVTDVNVFAAVFADGKTEPLAAATQAGFKQILTASTADFTLGIEFNNPEFGQALQGER